MKKGAKALGLSWPVTFQGQTARAFHMVDNFKNGAAQARLIEIAPPLFPDFPGLRPTAVARFPSRIFLIVKLLSGKRHVKKQQRDVTRKECSEKET